MAHFPTVIDWGHVLFKGVLERIKECENEGKKSGIKRRSQDSDPMDHCTRGPLRRRRECYMSELSVAVDVGNRSNSSSV